MGEVLRILVSSAVALRILLDQHPRRFKSLKEKNCGQMAMLGPKQKWTRQPLTLRGACNKIIHAADIKADWVVPDQSRNPDERGAYIRRFLYLNGTPREADWHAKLSIVDFARHCDAE